MHPAFHMRFEKKGNVAHAFEHAAGSTLIRPPLKDAPARCGFAWHAS